MEKPVIIVDPEILNGMPCFRGTRAPFKNLIDYLGGGHSLGEFPEQFPSVTREAAIQALEEPVRNTTPLRSWLRSEPRVSKRFGNNTESRGARTSDCPAPQLRDTGTL